MFADYTEFIFCPLTLKFNARNINNYKIIKVYFWRSASSKWLIFRRLRLEGSLISERNEDIRLTLTIQEIVKLFKSRHWNEKLNSTNRKQKKKIKDDRNRIIITKTEFKKKAFFRNAWIRKSRNEIQKIEIVQEIVSKRQF